MAVHGPVDPELDPGDVRRPRLAAAIPVIALGGSLGALARAGLDDITDLSSGAWPWPTLLVNVTGALGIGILMVVLLARFPHVRLARLFLITGVLGGYTTFSALTVEAVSLAHVDRPEIAAIYFAATIGGAVLACLGGAAAARAVLVRLANRQAHS